MFPMFAVTGMIIAVPAAGAKLTAEPMKSNRKVWIAIYIAAAIIFFGGYFGRVLETPYGFPFVIFCMLFGLAVNIYWWRTHRIERND